MILHSFRLKIGLLTLCLSGILLLAFGLFAVSALNRMACERVDRELRALVDFQIRKSQPEDHWRRFDESLHTIYGEQTERQFLVQVTRCSGESLYASSNWPTDLPEQHFPLSLIGAPVEAPPNLSPELG